MARHVDALLLLRYCFTVMHCRLRAVDDCVSVRYAMLLRAMMRDIDIDSVTSALREMPRASLAEYAIRYYAALFDMLHMPMIRALR